MHFPPSDNPHTQSKHTSLSSQNLTPKEQKIYNKLLQKQALTPSSDAQSYQIVPANLPWNTRLSFWLFKLTHKKSKHQSYFQKYIDLANANSPLSTPTSLSARSSINLTHKKNPLENFLSKEKIPLQDLLGTQFNLLNNISSQDSLQQILDHTLIPDGITTSNIIDALKANNIIDQDGNITTLRTRNLKEQILQAIKPQPLPIDPTRHDSIHKIASHFLSPKELEVFYTSPIYLSYASEGSLRDITLDSIYLLITQFRSPRQTILDQFNSDNPLSFSEKNFLLGYIIDPSTLLTVLNSPDLKKYIQNPARNSDDFPDLISNILSNL